MSVKSRLSTLHKKSWHQKLVTLAWGKELSDSVSRKACPYWWLVVPSSPIVAGLKFLAIAVAIAVAIVLATVVYTIIYFARLVVRVVVWFFGYSCQLGVIADTKRYVKSIISDNPVDIQIGLDLGRYKYNPRKKRDTRFAPFQVVLPIIAVVMAGWLATNGNAEDRHTLIIGGGYFVAGGFGLCLLGMLFRSLAPRMKKLCPDIVWVGDEPTN